VFYIYYIHFALIFRPDDASCETTTTNRSSPASHPFAERTRQNTETPLETPGRNVKASGSYQRGVFAFPAKCGFCGHIRAGYCTLYEHTAECEVRRRTPYLCMVKKCGHKKHFETILDRDRHSREKHGGRDLSAATSVSAYFRPTTTSSCIDGGTTRRSRSSQY
jgi:hypothetical protein